MRLRALLGAAVVVGGLGMAAPSPAAAVSPNCDWTTVIVDRANNEWHGHITAGPLLEPGGTGVDVTCELRIDNFDGPLVGYTTEWTPGPVGFLETNWTLSGAVAGRDFYLCTYTAPSPAGATNARGCSYEFTG